MDDERTDELKSIINSVKNTSDLYFLALAILSNKIGKGSLIPEMMFLFDEKSFLNLIYYYGGKSIQVPRISELRDTLYGIITYYYHDLMGYSYSDIQKLLGSDKHEQGFSHKLQLLRNDVVKSIQNIKLPDVLDEDKL